MVNPWHTYGDGTIDGTSQRISCQIKQVNISRYIICLT